MNNMMNPEFQHYSESSQNSHFRSPQKNAMVENQEQRNVLERDFRLERLELEKIVVCWKWSNKFFHTARYLQEYLEQ
jgi:hypothetical protein